MNYSKLFNSLPIFYEREILTEPLKKLPIGNMDSISTQTDISMIQQSSEADHLTESGYTYWQHWRRAMLFFLKTSKIAWIFFIHAWFPNVYQTLGKDSIIEMMEEF